MAIIGFIVLVLLGLYLLKGAIVPSFAWLALSGKFPWAYFLFYAGMGTLSLYVAVKYAPLTLLIS